MARLVAAALALTLSACASAGKAPAPGSFTFSGNAVEAAVGGRMVNHVGTTVRVDPVSGKSRIEGLRAEFVYLGLAGTDPAGRATIRVRYAEYRSVDGVEKEAPEHRAEVRLDLSRGKVMSYRGWEIGVVEATETAIRFVAVQGPSSP
ncbi:MAG: hypothetical protein WB493_13160 [Anaeromyxobacteraceae bacterium]